MFCMFFESMSSRAAQQISIKRVVTPDLINYFCKYFSPSHAAAVVSMCFRYCACLVNAKEI